jgi:iron complex transport system ATP-binding protein
MSLSASHITLKIGKKTILQNVSLAVEPGEFVAIIGPNGAGKSSLFKVLTQEYNFFSGQVTFNGKPYQDWLASELALQIGILPQSSSLNFPFSAFDVVMLGRLPHSTGKARDRNIAKVALHAVDAYHLADAIYPTLSGGEKQRVQLARVLSQIWEPTQADHLRYFLLDEPTSALDLSHQHLTLKLAKKLTKEHVGVIAILHDLNLAAEYADRIVMLKDGQLFKDGSIQETITPDNIKQLFNIDVNVIPHPNLGYPLVIHQ